MKHFYTGLDILIFILGLVIIISSTSAYGETSFSKQKNLIASNGLHTIKDHYKMVIKQTPYSVEICRDVTTSGDKTGDTILGAIIGGAIGNNVGDVENGGALGAVIGGMLGHANSDAASGTKRVCSIETRYKEETQEVYSHSTVIFLHEGKTYSLRFQK